MPIAVDDVVELIHYCKARAQYGLMVSHWYVEGFVGAVELSNLAQGFSEYTEAELKAVMSSEATFRGVTVQKIKPNPKSDKFQYVGDANVGQGAAPLMSTQTSGLFSLRTGLAGRANRGRKYAPFPGEGFNVAGGAPDGTYLAALDELAQKFAEPVTFIFGANSCDLVPCIYHRVSGFVTPVLSYVVRTEWATQRRRSQINRGDSGYPV